MAEPKAPTVEELQEKLIAAEQALVDQKAAAEQALVGAKYVIPKGFKRVDFSDGAHTYVKPGEIHEAFLRKLIKHKEPTHMGRAVIKVEK